MSRNEVLIEKTYKTATNSVGERVYYTLGDSEHLDPLKAVRTYLSLLSQCLVDRGALTERDIDALLIDLVTYSE